MIRLWIGLLSLGFVAISGEACAREQIRISGSSTVYPFAASVAEHFGRAGDYRTPIVEATGSGAGIKLFCSGVGDSYPDIVNSSRKILPSEAADCEKAGVHHPVEIAFGYDGITLAGSEQSPLFHLTKKQIFLGLARDIPRDGKLVTNDYTRWKQVDSSLPDFPIKVYGMPPVSGTRDTFVEMVMQKGCEQIPEFAAIADATTRKRQCMLIREDGRFIEAGENGNLIAQKLLSDPEALGIFGYSFLEQNTGRLHGSVIDGVVPNFESIQNGQYAVSRPLYFYVKREHLNLVPGLREYVQEFASEAAIGNEGYLVMQGLVPLSDATRANLLQHIGATLKP